MLDPWCESLAALEADVAFAAESGMQTVWLTQVGRLDAMTVIPHLAKLAPDTEFATGVVAIYFRHPWALASQALTTSLLTDGRFTLGIGLMHQPLVEGSFGMSFDRPVHRMSEYLEVLLPLLDQRPVDFKGDTVSFAGAVDVPGAPSCSVMLAALGPQMLRLCGARTSGTVTWMTGPKTLAAHVVPTLSAAADAAGRTAPRVAALVPVQVTDDVGTARDGATKALRIYGRMPSYRAMLDREGLTGPADCAIIGIEDDVAEQVSRYRDAGATDIGFLVLGDPEEQLRTRAFLAGLASTH
jgi:F420-dependent oxidoreductase-like protein